MGDAENQMSEVQEESLASDEEVKEDAQEEVHEETDTVEEDQDGDVREALRQTREENKRMKEMLSFMQNTMQTSMRPQVARQEEKKKFEFDPDEPVTGKDLLAVVESQENERSLKERETRVNMLEEVARSKYGDYDYVALNLFNRMQSANPGMLQAVLSSPNPPELAYQFGKMHPEYQKKEREKASVTTAKKIVSNSKKVTTLAESSGKKGVVPDTKTPDFANMSDEDFRKHVANIKAKQFK